MGFDKNDSQGLNQGIGLMGDLFDFFGEPERETVIDTSQEREEIARMMELDARQSAMAADNRNKETADRVHDEKEQARARRNARWGQSNIAMSGSRSLVRESRDLADRHEEDDVRAEGEQNVDEILTSGKRDANRYRISRGLTPTRTILTLGSSIYDKEL